MWNEIVTKIGALKKIDRQYQVFGAEHHRYRIAPRAGRYEIEQFESQNRFSLPAELREFYLTVGNGIVGPYYGLRQLGEIVSYRANEDYTEVPTLREIARQRGYDSESGDDYFEVDREELSGLVAVIDEGCSHELCLATNGKFQGTVVAVSGDGFVHETNQSLTTIYEQWVDRELEKFSMVERLMKSKASFDEIVSLGAEDIMVSIANVEKPVELFGTAQSRRYHGASQFPWYEGVLRKWRRRNNFFSWLRGSEK